MINKQRKIFTILVYEKEYDVYGIDGKEHLGLNDSPNTWWLYHSDRLPEGVEIPLDSPYWIPFCCKSMERRLWDIKITQKTTTKEKWGDLNFRSHTHIEIYCNRKLIYSFGTAGNASGLAFAMAKIQYLQVVLSEHPYSFFEPEKENGRKIYWKGLPATIKVKSDSWEISVIPDYTVGLSKEEWWKTLAEKEIKYPTPKDDEFEEMEAEDRVDDMQSDCINWGDALSDQYINWFRK